MLGLRQTSTSQHRSTGWNAAEVRGMARRTRKPDLRRIRASTCYTALEVADLLGVATGTVHSWLRHGLQCLKDGRPFLIPGDELKAWLKKRQMRRRQKCQPDEIFCFGCRAPRKPFPGSVTILPRNEKTTMIRGRCVVCRSAMNRGGSVARIDDARRDFGIHTIGQTRLVVSVEPIVKRNVVEEPTA